MNMLLNIKKSINFLNRVCPSIFVIFEKSSSFGVKQIKKCIDYIFIK